MMFSTAIWLLRFANWLNWIGAALLTLLLAALLLASEHFHPAIAGAFEVRGQAAVDAVWSWLVAACSMAVPVAICVHLALTRLVALLKDARIGQAFSEMNARRLTTVGWALLAINIVDLAFGQVSVWASATSGEYFGWSPSMTGWFAVLLLFLLAKVFREGAAMREDLEGTV